MSERRITRRSRSELRKGRTDWVRLRAMSDNDVAAAVADDPDAAPIVGRKWFETARLVMPADRGKVAVSLRLDEDVVSWFKRHGRGYQTRINAVLRAFMLEHRR